MTFVTWFPSFLVVATKNTAFNARPSAHSLPSALLPPPFQIKVEEAAVRGSIKPQSPRESRNLERARNDLSPEKGDRGLVRKKREPDEKRWNERTDWTIASGVIRTDALGRMNNENAHARKRALCCERPTPLGRQLQWTATFGPGVCSTRRDRKTGVQNLLLSLFYDSSPDKSIVMRVPLEESL